MGVDISYDFLSSKVGITSLVSADKNLPALALGGLTNGVSNMELTAAYCTFVNDGKYNTPITYTKVVDSNGKVILQKKTKSNVAISKETARTMNGLLKSVCDSGTGANARFGSYSIAGKTGTTDDDKDRWFVGYSPYYCAAVWVGYDTNESLSYFSSNPALKLWKLVMEEVHSTKNLPAKSFNYTSISVIEPSDSLDGLICEESGLKATENCPADKLKKGEPTTDSYCDIHKADPDDETENENDNNNSDNKENLPPLSDTGL